MNKKRESVPNYRAADPEYEAKIAANKWHDREEFDAFFATIKRLSEPTKWGEKGDYAPGSNRWSWARNTSCKYVELRIDMRDGGFVLTNREGRISLPMLEWQYRSEDE